MSHMRVKTANIGRSTNNVCFHGCPSKRACRRRARGARRRPQTRPPPHGQTCSVRPPPRGRDPGPGTARQRVRAEHDPSGKAVPSAPGRARGSEGRGSTTEPPSPARRPSPGGRPKPRVRAARGRKVGRRRGRRKGVGTRWRGPRGRGRGPATARPAEGTRPGLRRRWAPRGHGPSPTGWRNKAAPPALTARPPTRARDGDQNRDDAAAVRAGPRPRTSRARSPASPRTSTAAGAPSSAAPGPRAPSDRAPVAAAAGGPAETRAARAAAAPSSRRSCLGSGAQTQVGHSLHCWHSTGVT